MAGKRSSKPLVVSLFTGAGGLDVGLEAAGFDHALCVEIDPEARATLELNRPSWQLAEPGDIHQLSTRALIHQAKLKKRRVSLLAGGPPCQPFSKASYWAKGDSGRLRDPRARTLRAYLRVVEALLPKVILLENVKGLTFKGKDEGLRLLHREINAINKRKKTNYQLQVLHINAADYGVPQFRERVFVVANIDGHQLTLPNPTHGDAKGLKPYASAWDAIGSLDTSFWSEELNPSGKWADLLRSIPEGQNYLWHTPEGGGEPLFGWRTRYWSFLLKLAKDQPSWTISAEPGPATGPFHWRSRLLSVNELARLQTFPKSYRFVGNRRSAQRQIGNAVPCSLAELLGVEIRRQLLGENVSRELKLLTKTKSKRPRRERVMSVPRRYLALRARHRAHPGTGKGPLARMKKRSRPKGV